MRKSISIIIIIMIIMLMGCQNEQKAAAQEAAKVKEPSKQTAQKEKLNLITEKIPSESLKNNMLKEKPERSVIVYLPPSYYTSDKKYPVVYFLHGYLETPEFVRSVKPALDKQFKENEDNEFILVGPDAFNKLGGSFYVNSPVTGNWEDFIVKDLVNYIDQNYRTIPEASSRGISGFSMGGFGTLNLALKHPDVFSAAYIMSPGAFNENGLKSAMHTWDRSFLSAYGAAFSPNTGLDYPHANIPKFDGTAEDNKIVSDWENGFGNLKEKIESYKKLNTPIKAIRLVSGTTDSYGWIVSGTKYFAELLKDAEINCEYETFTGGHAIEPGFANNKLVDFFSKNLEMK